VWERLYLSIKNDHWVLFEVSAIVESK